MSKKITIKSYTSAGVYIRDISDATFDSFVKVINGGLGQLTLTLARSIDTFNVFSDVSVGNKIEVWISDENTTMTGVKVYSGFVEQQNPKVEGEKDYVEIVCYSMASKLKNDILKIGSHTKLYTKDTVGLSLYDYDWTAAEIQDVVEAIMDNYNIANPLMSIQYDVNGVSTVQLTGNLMKFRFEALTYFEAIDRCREVAPQNWYWIVNSLDQIEFKPISNSADHTFVLSKDVKSLNASNSADGIKNILLLFCKYADSGSSSIYKQYKDDASIALYGRRVEKMINNNFYDEDTMDNVGNSFINENKDLKIRLEIEIIDSSESDKGYDIESIDPGDTCKIVGLDVDGFDFGQNMIIKEVEYHLTHVKLIIETEKTYDMQKYLIKLSEEFKTLQGDAMQDSYT
jgi:hypothetical protein